MDSNGADASQISDTPEVPQDDDSSPEDNGGMISDMLTASARLLSPIAKSLVGDGSTIKDVTTEAPDFDMYNELYNRNMESTIDAQMGLTRDQVTSTDSNLTPAQQRLQRVNGGSMDVIDPNYQVSENQVIANYLSTFGYNR